MDILNKMVDSGEVKESVILHKWNSAVTNIPNDKITIYTATLSMSEKYRFNFYGLLKELAIPEYLLYPHLLINGFKTSTDYIGESADIKIINSEYIDGVYSNIIDEIKKERS